MTPLEQIKKEYDAKFKFMDIVLDDTMYHNQSARDLMWNFISQKILETEKRVAREVVTAFAKYADDRCELDGGGSIVYFIEQFINQLEKGEIK